MFSVIDLIHQTVLDVDAAGVRTGQIADEFFVGRRVLKRVPGKDFEEALRLGLEVGRRDFLRVLPGLLGVNEGPVHQPGVLEDLLSGSARPLRMESRIPGTERRYSVS